MTPRSRRPASSEDRLLPLINVVFLLLVFFMLAGRLASSDPFRIEPPHSLTLARPEGRELTVLMGADGRFALGGVPVEGEALEAAVRARAAGADVTAVLLKADGRVEAARVVTVTALLHDVGFDRVQLLTLLEQR